MEAFTKALDEDLNVSAAWGEIFEWVRATNKRLAENSLDAKGAASALAAWERLDSVLGLGAKEQRELYSRIPATDAAKRLGISVEHLLEEVAPRWKSN